MTSTSIEYRGMPSRVRVGAGRTISGWAVRFDVGSEIADQVGRFTEVFKRGAFTRTLTQRATKVRFLQGHNLGGLPLGTFTRLEERPEGLWVEAAVAETSAGDDVIALAIDGHDLGLSISFSVPAGGDSWDGSSRVRTITEAKLYEISVVGAPASVGAEVVGVRSADLLTGTPFADAARLRLDFLRKAQ